MVEIALLVLAVLLLVGTPIAFALMAATLLFFLANDLPLVGMTHRVVVGSENFVLTAVPFFILAAVIMNVGGLTRRIIRFADSLIGHWPGSLAQVNIGASMINSGITGSSLADTAGVGSVLIPEMKRKGYSAPFAAVVTAASSTIGPIIPPSIPFVIYGSIAGVSIGSLFLAGAVPGLIIGLALMLATRLVAVRRGYERGPRPTLAGVVTGIREGVFALGMPLLILGGIAFGVFTPTEAAAVACGYAVLVTGLIYRELRPAHLRELCEQTISLAVPPLLIIVAMAPFSMMLAWQQIPQQLTAFLLALSQEPLVILLLILAMFFVLGLITDGFPIFFLVTPMLLPVAFQVGIDPVHLGVLITITVLLGNLTPPFGLLMFLSCNIAGCSIAAFTREVWPYLIALALVILLLALFPQIVLWLPHVVMDYPM